MTTEDLRLIANGGQYVEVDSLPSSDADGTMKALTASALTLTAFPANQNYYRYRDFGANFFSERFYAEGSFNLTASGSQAKDLSIIFGDTIGAERQQVNAAGMELYISNSTTTPFYPYVAKYESSVEGGSAAGAALTAGTTYYYRLGVLSSLGRYGAIWFSIYSNAAMTTHVTTKVLQRTVSRNYRYFYPATTYNAPATGTVSGTHQDITLFYPTAGADITTYTALVGTHIAKYADVAVITTLGTNETDYLYKDFGADYFAGNFNVRGVLNISAFATGGGAWMFNLLTFNNLLQDGAAGGDYSRQGIGCAYLTTSTYVLAIKEHSGTAEYSGSGSPVLSTNTPYFIEISRDAAVGAFGTLYLKVYSDPEYTRQVGSTSSLALQAAVSFRYLNLIQTTNYSVARSTTFTLGGVKFPPTSMSVTGSGGFVVGGSATITTGPTVIGSGGFVVGGSATITTSRSVVGSSGFVVGGSGTVMTPPGAAYGTGGFVVGGSAAIVTSQRVIGSGGFVIGGSATITIPVTDRRVIFPLFDVNGDPITGASPTLIVYREIDGFLYDFADKTFKSSGWTTLAQTMTAIDAVNLPGYYSALIDIGVFQNGYYQATCAYTAGAPKQRGALSFSVYGGRLVDDYLPTQTAAISANVALLPSAAQTAAAVGAHAIEGAITSDEKDRILLAALSGRRSGIGTSTEIYYAPDGTTPRITLTPDQNGNGTPVVTP